MREEIEILRLGHQGDGIAQGPTYVSRTLPGEIVSGVRTGNHLTDVRIVTPSPDRVKAPCRHYQACGGCQLQHASDAFMTEWKQDVVRSALAGHGLETRLRAPHVSPPRSRRRATVSARRTKKGTLAGFHARASNTITGIPDCLLLVPPLMTGLKVAEQLAALGASRKAELSVTMTLSLPGLDIAVAGGKPLDGPLRAALGQYAAQAGLARLTWEKEPVAMQAVPEQQFGAARVVPPPGAFLQATADGEAAIVAAVSEATDSATRIVDLFAGCGTLSLPLASRADIHAVEGDGAMTQALEAGWRKAQGLKQVTTETRDLYRRPLTADELSTYEAVVLDPPRAGAEAQIAEIADVSVPRIAYVSCNPVSFARDAAVLVRSGYAMDWIRIVDQFRWSVHTELVAAFSRSNT